MSQELSSMKRKVASGWHFWIALALIVLFCVVSFFEARLQSPVYDEPPHIAAGLSYFVTHQIFRANPQHPPLLKELSALSLMAASIRWPHSASADYLVNGDDPARVFSLDWPIGNEIIRTNGPDRTLIWARLPMILVAALLGVLLFLWGRQLLGPLAAVGAVFIFVLDPTILSHSHFVTTDVGAASFTILALFALWNYLRQPSWARLLLCGLALGAALVSKFSVVLLLPLFGLLMLAGIRWPVAGGRDAEAAPGLGHISKRSIRPKDLCPCGSGKKYKNCHGSRARGTSSSSEIRRKLRFAAGALAVLCLVAFVFVQATYFFPSDLTMYVKCARMVNADHDPGYLAYMAGELQPRFTSYFLAAYWLKEPLAIIILASIGLVAMIRSKSIPVLGKLFLLVPPVAFFTALTLVAGDLGVRYIIPVLPFTFLWAGLGIASLLEAADRFRWAPYAAAALCLWVVIAAAGVYPDHLSYFNEAACLLTKPGQIGMDGGSRCGPEWLDDSNVDWGQGLRQLKVWLDQHAPGREVKVALMTSFPAAAYGIKGPQLQTADLMRNPDPGLYAVSAHLVARLPALGQGANWLRQIKPVAIVGHALYIYDIPAR